MKLKILMILGIVVTLMILFGVNGRSWARPSVQEGVVSEGTAEVAVVNGRISYQGYLTDPSTGDPLTGSYNMRFRLWDNASGGSQVGPDIVKNNTAVAEGLFNVTLDIPDETFDGQGRWIQIQVNGEWLNPRREILPVPYALSLRPGASVTGRMNNDEVIQGINTATTGWSNGIMGLTDSSEGVGVLAINTGATGGNAINAWSGATTGFAAAVFAESRSPEGYGVYGENLATTGSAAGVVGVSNSSGAKGVEGLSRASTGEGSGVFGDGNSPDGSGVFGYNDNGGNGVLGITDSGTGSGVHGASYIASGSGVSGVNYATSGWSIGVYGETSSPDGGSIIGVNTATTGAANAVKGISSSADGAAVVGWNEAGGIGLQGYSTTGTALTVGSMHGNLIEAYEGDGSNLKFYVSNDGNVYADGTYQSPAADFAEMLPAHDGLEPGDVLIIGADGQLALSIEPYQSSVVGVYSTDPGFLGGAAEDADSADNIPLAIVGIVPVKVSAENGPIQPGDLLTSSATPGYAMVCHDRLACIGAIIGKAMEPLTVETGIISVLITLQ